MLPLVQTLKLVFMKKLILAVIAFTVLQSADAQLIKRMADRAKNRMEQKAGEKVDKSVDEATDWKKKEKKQSSDEGEATNEDQSESTSSDESSSSSSSTSGEKEASLKAYSKYDFIPGDKVISFEDFAGVDIGDFPTRWNTNATAEVVTLDSREGKWLKMAKDGVFHPEFVTNLPENFTLEFDLGINNGWNSWPLEMNIAKLNTPEDFTDYGKSISWKGDHALHLSFKPAVSSSGSDGDSKLYIGKDGNHSVDNHVAFNTWNNGKKNFAHISIWRQKQRLRVYLNGEKIWDIPRGFDAAATYNAITFANHGAYHTNNDFYLLSNIRLAVGSPDTRNRLITEGKFVTRGILFDVNKAEVKAESFGTLKDIANVLKENADVKVKIVGHTDSDGDDAKNLELSKQRAAAVKAALAKDFGIDESRMETDGKGETEPSDKNDSAAGKANNRRVEFIKL
jgi:OOP family OmpA-OmpF porin